MAFVPQASERRFIIDDVTEVLAALHAHSGKVMRYDTTTFYLDSKHGTWSRGNGGMKFRLRNYGTNDNLWWFETKDRDGVEVTKERVKIRLSEFDALRPLRPLFAVTYRRTAFEFSDGLRVTVDRELTAWTPELTKVATFRHYIVEVKRTNTVPEWLSCLIGPHEEDNFSKSQWALSLIYGIPM